MRIIAPAGDIERMKAAIKGGADEVYLGLKGFGARRSAINFTINELKDAIDYAHLRGVRVLLTLNTIMKDSELDSLYMNLSSLYEHGLDAVIVQDLGVFRYLKDNFKDLEIHGSTQMTVANHIEANYLYNLGFKRVVLSRELSFEEIKTIRKKTKIELEVFVSGALCISYSGNCYISSFIGSRSGNRGMCAQVCRKKYTTNKEESGYLLSPKDQMLDKVEIEKLKNAGIDAIKIEGRMKSPNYVYEMVGKYSDILIGKDGDHHPEKIFNRGYSKGYFYKNDSDKLMNSQYASNYGYSIGDVRGRILKLNTTVILGDGIAYLDKDMNILEGEYLNQIIIMGKKVKEAKRLDLINIYPPKGTKFIYKTFDKALNDSIESTLKTAKGRMSVGGKFFAHVGEPLRFDIYANGITLSVTGDVLEEAKKRPLDNETIFEKLGEMGNSTLKLSTLDIQYDGKAFVSLKTLKDIKRCAIEKFENEYLATTRRTLDSHVIVGFTPTISENDYKTTVAVSVVNKEQFKVAKEFGIKKIYYRGPEVAKESNLDKIDIKSRLASNLYQLIQNEKMAALGQLASGIAHEIRNPLTSIKTFFDLYPQRKDDEYFTTDFFNTARGEVDRITRLTGAMLNFTQSRGPVFQEEDLHKIIDEALLMINEELSKKQIKLEKQYGPNVFLINADRVKIEEALIDIILNAVQAIDHNQGKITISTQLVQRDSKSYLQIKIKDNGFGIDKENLETIFDPLFSTDPQKVGLGLTIANQRIEEHQGFIEVRSKLKKGSSFFIYLLV